MDVKNIIAGAIMVGDELQINDWEDRFVVCAVSRGFILAHHGDTKYTIIQRKPTDFGPYNGIPKDTIVCGPDWWIFGWTPENPDDDIFSNYEFDNQEWCKLYMADLDSGRTEISMRHREIVHRLDTYRDGVLVFEMEAR